MYISAMKMSFNIKPAKDCLCDSGDSLLLLPVISVEHLLL